MPQTKRQRLAEWIQKQDPYICCLQETHLKTRDTVRLKVKGCKNRFHANRDQKKAEVAILISDKIYLKTKAVVQKLLILIRFHLFIFTFISNILGGGS